MELDIRQKLALQMGNLLLANVELSHQLEGASSAAAAHAQRADQLQAAADEAAAATKPADEVAAP